jgi:hypothetical protein
MPNVVLYMLGVFIVAGALAYGASILGVGQTWIAILVAVIAGFGLMGAVAKTRAKEEPD